MRVHFDGLTGLGCFARGQYYHGICISLGIQPLSPEHPKDEGQLGPVVNLVIDQVIDHFVYLCPTASQ